VRLSNELESPSSTLFSGDLTSPRIVLEFNCVDALGKKIKQKIPQESMREKEVEKEDSYHSVFWDLLDSFNSEADSVVETPKSSFRLQAGDFASSSFASFALSNILDFCGLDTPVTYDEQRFQTQKILPITPTNMVWRQG